MVRFWIYSEGKLRGFANRFAVVYKRKQSNMNPKLWLEDLEVWSYSLSLKKLLSGAGLQRENQIPGFGHESELIE